MVDSYEDSNPQQSPSARLLIIEDQAMQHGIIRRIAEMAGFTSIVARTFSEAAALLRTDKFDCITLDLSLGGEHHGTEVLRVLEELHCKTPVVIISGATGMQLQLTSSIARSMKLNICEAIAKPIDPPLLRQTLRRIKQGLPRRTAAGSTV